MTIVVNFVPAPAAQIRGVTNVCNVICPRWCEKQSRPGANVTHCHIVCGDLCEGQLQSNNPYVGNQYFEVVSTEFEFARYDADHDKRISVHEFAAEENVPVEDAQKIFDFADFNDDGFIDEKEFHGGPFIFTVQMAAEFSNMGRLGNKASV
ncbi:EF-hand calcium-binding domain-containing protein 1-like [Dreissena polymorpha]|uniref:EF-hand calcium-binding domain-containing protein 1-like n=1 Tax=Dreissena polymorpha TaxID=45954 RepID=UPI0022644E4B|nr:EF-hand calcium-binding domain-containing protein 1-like [Dreissena polymorpha]